MTKFATLHGDLRVELTKSCSNIGAHIFTIHRIVEKRVLTVGRVVKIELGQKFTILNIV